MRILFLGNNWVGWQVAKWFKEQDHEVVGLVVHPSSTQQYRDGIATALGLPASQVFDGSRLREPATREAINDLNADIGLSVYFGYILRAEFIDMFEKGIIDPVKVTRCALQNAVSVSSTLLTANHAIVEEEKNAS